MKCKYYGESLNWNTERKGAKGGSDSLFQVFTFIDSRDLGRGAQGVKERKFRQKIEGSFSSTCLQALGKSRRLCSSGGPGSELEQVKTCSVNCSAPEITCRNRTRFCGKLISCCCCFLFFFLQCASVGRCEFVRCCFASVVGEGNSEATEQRGRESDKDVGFQKRFSM